MLAAAAHPALSAWHERQHCENLSPSRYAKGQLTYVSASMSSLPSSSLTKAAQNGKDSNCEHHAAN